MCLLPLHFPSYADALCSGKVACEIPTRDLIVHFKPCPLELSAYLEASHICIPGKKRSIDFVCSCKVLQIGVARERLIVL